MAGPVYAGRVHIYTDGAATHPKYEPIRRAGWAFIAPEIDLVQSGPIHGPIQTAYRGEIKAFVQALETVPGDLLVWTDNLNAQRTWRRVAQGETIRGSHADLWRLRRGPKGTAASRLSGLRAT